MNDPIADLITAWIVVLVICALWNTRKSGEPDDYPDAGAGTDDGGFAASQRAGHVESLDDYTTRMRDTNYGTAREARQRFNAQQGDPQ